MPKCDYAPVQNDTIMIKCEYAPVQNDAVAENYDSDNVQSWIPFFRQLMVCMSMCILYFQIGLCLGTPTVLIPRMREDNGDDYISQAFASWIYSVINYSSLPWIPILAILASYIGRRYTYSLGVVASLVGFSLLYAGDTSKLVLGTMIVQGLPLATLMMSFFILTEYTSPNNRGVFLTLKSATLYWGIWVANAIGTVAHWRYIAVLGLVCGICNVMTLFMWPESPYWLASKGMVDQCKEAHWWLKGHSASSEKELQELIKSQQLPESERMEERLTKTRGKKWKNFYDVIKSKYVYKSVLISLALQLQYGLSGKTVYTVYAIDIIKTITNSKNEAYKGMLILDGVTVLGMYIGCALSNKLKRRTLLFSSGAISVAFLFVMSLYLYLIKLGFFLENNIVTLFLLTGFSLSVSCGPIILNVTLSSELLPLRLRSTCAAFLGMFTFLCAGTLLKIAPWIFNNLGMPGAFFLYGLTSGIFLIILYTYLPETKNKTLKEIESLIVAIGSKSGDKNQPRACSDFGHAMFL